MSTRVRAYGRGQKNIRQREAKPLVNKFFTWVQKHFDSQGLLPSSPLTKELSCAHKRRVGLEVYLNDPDVPIDTNRLERALQEIPMGRKNWLFCGTETGAEGAVLCNAYQPLVDCTILTRMNIWLTCCNVRIPLKLDTHSTAN